jgi:tRNA G26 N,N-dimethylase Trm1
MLTKIKCSKCGADNTFSLSDPMYVGPFKCYKCHTTFKITMEHNVLKSCEPLSGEELAKMEEIQAMKDKFRHGGAV